MAMIVNAASLGKQKEVEEIIIVTSYLECMGVAWHSFHYPKASAPQLLDSFHTKYQ